MQKGKFYSTKCEDNNFSKELQLCIENSYDYCHHSVSLTYDDDAPETEKKPIMMLGKIQSGKTRAYTGLIALAFDNIFDMVIILTKNSKPLVQQTLRRMKHEFSYFIEKNKVNVFDIMKAIEGLTPYELNKKLIIVAKKETKNLDKISNFISDYTLQQSKYCLIIDDEADSTSIGFNKIKGEEKEFDLRTIASKINNLRGTLAGYAFVQVTATPYALFLQPEFNEKDIEPIKPKWTVLVPEGEKYIGGDYYFIKSKDEKNPAFFIYEEISPDELNIVTLKKEDRRRFKDEEILKREDKLIAFKKGLINFIVGGSILRINNSNSHYAYVIHTSTQKEAHKRIEYITNEFLNQLSKDNRNGNKEIIENMLIEAYYDIENSIIAHGNTMPNFNIIENLFYQTIDNGFISLSIINSDKDIFTLLDEDTGEIKLRTPFSIIIGGQALDRGVTINNMIGFYYGRNPKTMQQDTVLQHSRMFGYRDNDLLSVTRFYTTHRIHENMTKITEIDSNLRQDLEKGKAFKGIYFIHGDEGGQVVPCSPSKIWMSNITILDKGRRILPIGFSPIAKSYAARISTKIINKLHKLMDINNKNAITINKQQITALVHLVYSSINQDEGAERFITEDRFISILNYLSKTTDDVYLMIRMNRNLSKYKGQYKNIYSDAPDTEDEIRIAKEVSRDKPTILLIHENGTGEGWNGSEFWWPIIVVQQNFHKTIFSLQEPFGKFSRNHKSKKY